MCCFFQYPHDTSTSSEEDDPPPYKPPSYQNYRHGLPQPGKTNVVPPSESAQSLQSPDAVDSANDILLNLAGLPPFESKSPTAASASAVPVAKTITANGLSGISGVESDGIMGAEGGAIGGAVGGATGGVQSGAVGGAVAMEDPFNFERGATASGGKGIEGVQRASAFPFEDSDITDVKKPIRDEDFSPMHQAAMPPKMLLLEHDYTGSTAKPKRHYRNWNPPMLGTLPDDFLRIMITPEPSPVRCPAHPHAHTTPRTRHHPSSSPKHQMPSPHHQTHSRSAVSPSRPSMIRAETLPSKVENTPTHGSPKGKTKDFSSRSKTLHFGFRSRKQKSESDSQGLTEKQLSNSLNDSLRNNPMSAAVSAFSNLFNVSILL